MKRMRRLLVVLGIMAVACGGKKGEAPSRGNLSPPSRHGFSEKRDIEHTTRSDECVVVSMGDDIPSLCHEADAIWQALFVNGEKSGYTVQARRRVDGYVESCRQTSMRIRRGSIVVEANTVVTMKETDDGRPVSYRYHMSGSGMNRSDCGVVRDGALFVTTINAGEKRTRQVEWMADALFFFGVDDAVEKAGYHPGTRYSLNVFDPESQQIMTHDYVVGKKEPLHLLGKRVFGTRIEIVVHAPGRRMSVVEWVDSRTTLPLRNQADMMGFEFEAITCDRKLATEKHAPPELFTATFMASPRVLSRGELQSDLRYLLVPVEAGDSQLVFPQSYEQTVRKDEKTGNIYVRVTPRSIPAGKPVRYGGGNSQVEEALQANSYLQSDAPEIRALAKQAVGNARDVRTAAHNIERFVSHYIHDRTLAVGYASALEVARNRQGDCTEFAVLVAAIARAAGIPSRIAFGIVYMSESVDGARDFFGGHAWAQVYVDGRWYSLDAALDGFSSGHIAVDYNHGEPTRFYHLVNTMGYFTIASVDRS